MQDFARGGGGGGQKEGRWLGEEEATPIPQRLCAYSVRQFLVLSTLQPTPRLVRARTSEVEVVSLPLDSLRAKSPSWSSAVKEGVRWAFSAS